MTDASWGDLSQQAIGAAGVVYFLALIAHLVEWSAFVGSRRSSRAEVAVGAVGSSDIPAERPDGDGEQRVAMFARLGLLLTVLGAGLHLLGLVGRGLSADPNRVPWGNMYEFTIS